VDETRHQSCWGCQVAGCVEGADVERDGRCDGGWGTARKSLQQHADDVDFRQSDGYPQSAIVNQTFAHEFLHDDNPVGRSSIRHRTTVLANECR